jgi:hypothetical protein
MGKFRDLFESDEWVIYDGESGKILKGPLRTYSDAKKAVKKFDNGVVASFEWWNNNQNDIDALRQNAKSKSKRK